jgi:hypothetical protein
MNGLASFAQVTGPTMPSRVRHWTFWQAMTA